MARPLIIVTTMLRPRGETGVQTQIGHQLEYTSGHRPDVDIELVTPFDLGRACLPLFAPRVVLDRCSRALALRWYHVGHRFALERALRRRLQAALQDPQRGTVYVHVHDSWSASAALRARDRLTSAERARVVIPFTVHYLHSEAEEWVQKGVIQRASSTWRRLRAVEQDVLRRVDATSYLSDVMRQHVESQVRSPAPRRTAITSNGVRIPPLPATTRTRDLIAIGTLEQRKNQQFLLHVLAACRQLGRSYGLTLVGTGPDRSTLEQLATDLDVARQVTFAGYVPGASRLIPQHRALVHGSFGESFGNVFLEAMAHATPVFAAPHGAVGEVFSDGVEGRHWQLDDPRAAASMLVETLEDPELHGAMSRRARARAESLSWDRQYARLTEFVLGTEPLA